MKILQLCNKPPLPLLDGGCIAMHNISQGLIDANIDIKILTISTAKHPFDLTVYPDNFIEKTKIESVFIDTSIKITKAIGSIFSSGAYNVKRFYSVEFEKKLNQILSEDTYDIVHLESLYMTPYIKAIRKHSKAKISLRAHNIEFEIWEYLARYESNPLKKKYLKQLTKKLKSYEIKTWSEVDCLLPISDVDAKKIKNLGCKVSMLPIPFGVNLDDYLYRKLSIQNPINLFHIGALNWLPNKEAVEFIIEKIWPKISNLSVKMNLAGRNIPGSILKNESTNFKIYGEVANAISFMEANDIMIVPLQSASGVRIKIIEAMALGKIVISTSIGAEGIDFVDGKNILIANTVNEFVEQIKYCIDNPVEAAELGTNARMLIEETYSNSRIIEKLISFYNDLLDNSTNTIC